MSEIENDKQIAWIFILEFHRLVDMLYIMTFIDHVITKSIYKLAVAKTRFKYLADGS